jgi:hypothetical protein
MLVAYYQGKFILKGGKNENKNFDNNFGWSVYGGYRASYDGPGRSTRPDEGANAAGADSNQELYGE